MPNQSASCATQRAFSTTSQAVDSCRRGQRSPLLPFLSKESALGIGIAMLLIANCAVAGGQTAISGVVLAPNGAGLQNCTVVARPMRPGGAPVQNPNGGIAFVRSGAGGNYQLDVIATEPFELVIGDSLDSLQYPQLSQRATMLQIDCVLGRTAAKRKKSLLDSILDAVRWGQAWNQYVPEGDTNFLRVVAANGESTTVAIPPQQVDLLMLDVDRLKNTKGPLNEMLDATREDNGVLLLTINAGTSTPQRLEKITIGYDAVGGDGKPPWANAESWSPWRRTSLIPVFQTPNGR